MNEGYLINSIECHDKNFSNSANFYSWETNSVKKTGMDTWHEVIPGMLDKKVRFE